MSFILFSRASFFSSIVCELRQSDIKIDNRKEHHFFVFFSTMPTKKKNSGKKSVANKGSSNKCFMPKTLPKCPFPQIDVPKSEPKIEEPSA